MELQVGVKILIQNREGKFLFLERNPEKYPEVKKNHLLDIVGGRIKIGLALLENLKREVAEETGLSIVGEPKLLAAQDILKTDKHVVRLTYLGQAEGDIKLSEEHSSYLWLTKNEAQSQEGLDPYTREVFEKILSKG